jgi:hypothetical protein
MFCPIEFDFGRRSVLGNVRVNRRTGASSCASQITNHQPRLIEGILFSGNDIRTTFLKFFADRRHRVVRNSSLVPTNDPTLLFTNA